MKRKQDGKSFEGSNSLLCWPDLATMWRPAATISGRQMEVLYVSSQAWPDQPIAAASNREQRHWRVTSLTRLPTSSSPTECSRRGCIAFASISCARHDASGKKVCEFTSMPRPGQSARWRLTGTQASLPHTRCALESSCHAARGRQTGPEAVRH